MKPPEKLRELAIQLNTMRIAESLDIVETTLTHHWRDADDEPQSRRCNIKIVTANDKLTIQWVVDKNWAIIYDGPINWLYGIHRYEDEA